MSITDNSLYNNDCKDEINNLNNDNNDFISYNNNQYNTYNYNNHYVRQCVGNSNMTPEEIQRANNQQLRQVRHGWRIIKTFTPKLVIKDPDFDVDKKYRGVISDYEIYKVKNKQDEEFIYILFIMSIYTKNQGMVDLQFKTSANFTQNSVLTKFLFDLGYNVANMQYIELDELIGMPIYVELDRKNEIIEVSEVRPRVVAI